MLRKCHTHNLEMILSLTFCVYGFFFFFFCSDNHNLSPEEKAALIASTKSPISFLSKLSRKRNPKVNVLEMLLSIPSILLALLNPKIALHHVTVLGVSIS